jgi:hypothetical protein
MNLTAMQEKAAVEFYRTKSWEKAARAAGYQSTSAASELRCNPKIKERVKQLEECDSLIEYATLNHCTDFLIKAALGQVTEIKIGLERHQVPFGSKIRKQISLDKNGTVQGTTITFESEPLRALELLIRCCDWSKTEPFESDDNRSARTQRILSIVRQLAERKRVSNPE